MREADLERRLRDKVRKAGGLCLKWVSPGFTGVPDRIILMPGGRILFAELKAPDLKRDGRTPRQKRVAGQLQALGFTVIRVDCLEDIDPYIREEVRP